MDLIGRTLGQYRVLEKIGAGGMADVYKAKQKSLGRDVAIKILPAVLGRDDTFRARFDREARSAAQLHHPNILNVFDYGEDDGVTFIVMEYAGGGTLKDRMKEPLLLEETADMIGHVASALAYAHRQGVIHRDIKPSNVLLTEDGWPMLADFGLSKMVEGSKDLTASGVSVGTPEYMSPEQGQGLPTDHRSDIYSLGVMLYEMVTGQKPYTGDTPMAVIIKHMTETLPSPRLLRPDLPASIERIIVRAMAKSPKDRYQSADGMVKDLRAALRRTKTVPLGALKKEVKLPDSMVRPLSEMPSHPLSPRRGRVSIWAALVALLLLVGGGGGLAWGFVPGFSDALSSLFAPSPTASATRAGVPSSTLAFLPSPTGTDTRTPTPTFTLTPAPTQTAVVVVAATSTKTAMPTSTATGTATRTPAATPTQTPFPSLTPTATSTPTATPSRNPTATPTPRAPPGMVWVPAGTFRMGSSSTELIEVKRICRQSTLHWPCPDYKEEQPQREVWVEGFWIDQNEVTNDQFTAFVEAAGYQTEAEGRGDPHDWRYYTLGKPDHPVVGVSWNDAHAYCEWQGKRLPSEAEWEKAARGIQGYFWPWGSFWDAARLNSLESGFKGTEMVGVRGGGLGPSPYGLDDMAGNVCEWTSDWWGEYQNPHRPPESDQGWGKAVRGGSWRKQGHETRTTFRGHADPGSYADDIGFRCAQ
jgi:serine/threonine protein kinase